MKLDHLAVVCGDLDAGRAYVEAALGAPMQAGGTHAAMGTHNLLMGLDEGIYLEVIAIDPAAPPPGRARWFALDRFKGASRLGNWICAVNDIAEAPRDSGAPMALGRGDLRWQMAVPKDGELPFDNCFPALISWQGSAHPAERLTPTGLRLTALEVRHPEAGALASRLPGLAGDARIRFQQGAPSLSACFVGPDGRERWLR